MVLISLEKEKMEIEEMENYYYLKTLIALIDSEILNEETNRNAPSFPSTPQQHTWVFFFFFFNLAPSHERGASLPSIHTLFHSCML